MTRSRARADLELADIPGTAPGMGLRVSRKTRLMGVMGLGVGLPRPVEDVVVQRIVVEVPDVCGRCGSQAIMFNRDIETPGPARRVSCFTCGWDAFLVTAPLAAVTGVVEIERQALGTRTTVKVDAPPVRSARPRRNTDRRKRRYTYCPERPVKFQRNGGVSLFP